MVLRIRRFNMNTHSQFGYDTVRRTENKQSFVFQKMWAIISVTAKLMNIPKSQVSKSEALKLAYECWNTRTLVIEEESYILEKTKGAKRVQKVVCNPDFIVTILPSTLSKNINCSIDKPPSGASNSSGILVSRKLTLQAHYQHITKG